MSNPSESELHDIVQKVVRQTMLGGDTPTLPAPPTPASRPVVPTINLQPKTPASTGQKVAIGADHGGFGMKEALIAFLQEKGYRVEDCGAYSREAVDYPDFAYAVAKLVSNGDVWRGVIIDGAGIGSCMAANKVSGVRAAMCYDYATAVNSREHNNANVLTLGAGLIGPSLAKQILETWLKTEFGGGRHARRVDKIMAIETT
jgi:ribose 5-phosphate isomerase B